MRGSLLAVVLVSAAALPALAATYHVPGDYPNINAAMDIAVYGDSIVVACANHYQCTYNMIPMKSGVTLISETGDPECAPLHGSPDSWTIIYCHDCDSTTRIEGFTFRYVDHGPLVLLSGDSAPTFANCIFEGEFSRGHVHAYGGAPVFEDCIFTGGPVSVFTGATMTSFTATRCIFEEIGEHEEIVDDDCVAVGAHTATFEDCIFRNNGGHGWYSEVGVLVLNCTECSLTGCSFHDNLTNWAVASSPVVLIDANETAIIENCTFANNRSDWTVIFISDGSAVLSNTLIAFNIGAYVPVDCYGDAVVQPYCCDIFGNEGGDWVGCLEGLEGIDGNISLDPILCGDENPEAPLSIRSDSPCAPFTPPNPECDLIGAWPVGCEPMAVEEDHAEQLGRISLSPCQPNPGRDSFHLSYTIPELLGDAPVRLEVFDAAGRWVNTLVIENAAPGGHTATWNGRDDRGRKVPAGIYTYRLEVGGESLARRSVVIR